MQARSRHMSFAVKKCILRCAVLAVLGSAGKYLLITLLLIWWMELLQVAESSLNAFRLRRSP